jgi:hypothetical protein
MYPGFPPCNGESHWGVGASEAGVGSASPLPPQDVEKRAGRHDGDAVVRPQGQQVIVAGDDGVDAGFDRGL